MGGNYMANYSGERKLARCVSNAPNQSVYFNYPRRVKQQSSNCEDRISSLPDDILVHILSLLKDIREAIRTSVLSKKWQHLWHDIPNYDFTTSLTLPKVHNQENFVYCVNNVVCSSRASSINRFKVHCALGAKSRHWISEWLVFAMRKSVKELKLYFSSFAGVFSSRTMPPVTLPSLWRYVNFPSVHTLVSLTLGALCVTTDFLDSLLFTFTNLERLTMKRVLCVEYEFKLRGLYKKNMKTKVVGSLLKLRHLEITACQGFGEIEISAEKLTSLVYFGSTEGIKFSYVPLLNEATFYGQYSGSLIRNVGIISGFSSQLSRLKLVTHEFEKIIQRPLVVPNQFGNLKEFELFIYGYSTESHLPLTNFIDACPSLHKFKLQRMLRHQYSESDIKKWNWKESRDDAGFVAMKHHRCLNIFEMVGFLGAKVDIELVLLLAQEAIPLEKIILDPNQRTPKGKVIGGNVRSMYINLMEIARKEANLLRNYIPPRVQIEVVNL